jgi:hypothetical protein
MKTAIRLAYALLCSVPCVVCAFASFAGDDLDDLMGGFDDDLDTKAIEEAAPQRATWLEALPYGDWLAENVDLSGSLAAGSTYSYLDHKVPHGDEPGRSTFYGNLTRLDLDGALQLDVRLPKSWLLRAEAVGFYDFVYRIKGRGNYGGAVLDVYEWQVDTGELYVSGPLSRNLDLTVGRKIVNWGRSDTFRVVDVINPLDQKEPGLVDIEHLRRPRTMVKLDATSGPWSAQLLVIPEHRFDRLPPQGSDYYPDQSGLPAFYQRISIADRNDFSGTPGLAAKIDGRFSGWDFSLYGAYVDETNRVLDLQTDTNGVPTGLRAEPNRFGMVGAAGNVTHGPWLFKAEGAFLTDIRVFQVKSGLILPSSDSANRIDTMIGVEYYAVDDLTIAIEIVSRNLLDHPGDPQTPQLEKQTRIESALRITRPFFRDRLDLTLLAVGYGQRLQNGGIVRMSGDYDLTDSWQLGGGVIFYIGGQDPGIGAYNSNNRFFAELKYSF